MDIRTHRRLDPELCGRPTWVEEGRAEVVLEITAVMTADASGLAHGGFLFGAADHAAMLAVNHPNVVLARADVRFLAPVAVGDTVVARARLVEPSTGDDGGGSVRTHQVEVEALVGERTVFAGTMGCVVPQRHVLEGSGAAAEEVSP